MESETNFFEEERKLQESFRQTVERLCNYPQEIEGVYDQKREFRLKKLCELLQESGVEFTVQESEGYRNVVCRFGEGIPKLIVSGHYDAVDASPGANDNASSVSLCVELAKRLQEAEAHPYQHGIEVIFFDGEEDKLKGSRQFVRSAEFKDVSAVINLEFVGIGDTPILWPVSEKNAELASFLTDKNEEVQKFPQPEGINSDHTSFLEQGIPAMKIPHRKRCGIGILP